MQFGQGSANYLVDSPQAVAQLVLTRLKLFRGEWFLDVTDGLPFVGQIVGANTAATRDRAIKTRILETPGVTAIGNYSSTVANRVLTVTCTITTAYGTTPIAVTI